MKMLSNEEYELLDTNKKYEYLAYLGDLYIDSEFTNIKAFNQLFILSQGLRRKVTKKFYISFKHIYDIKEAACIVDSCFLEVVRSYDKKKDTINGKRPNFMGFISTRLFFRAVDLGRVEFKTRRPSNQGKHLFFFDPNILSDPDDGSTNTYSSMYSVRLAFMINQALCDDRYMAENFLESQRESEATRIIRPYFEDYIQYLKESKAGDRIKLAQIYLEELTTLKGRSRVRKEFSHRSEKEIEYLVSQYFAMKTLFIDRYYHKLMTDHFPQKLEEHYKIYLELKPYKLVYSRKAFSNLLKEYGLNVHLYECIERSHRKTQRNMRQMIKEGVKI